jgi:hypothetical protein
MLSVESTPKTNFILTSKIVDRYSIVQKKPIPNTQYPTPNINHHPSYRFLAPLR